MKRPWSLAAVLTLAGWSGCLGALDPDYGDFELQVALVEGDEPIVWRTELANYTFEAEPLRLEKEEPGPQGGGGTRVALESPVRPLVLHARIVNGTNVVNATATWMFGTGYEQPEQVELAATETFTLPIDSVGSFQLSVRLGDGGSSNSYRQAEVQVEARWFVESSVHPLKLEQQPYPTNYDEMADAFIFDLPDEGFTNGYIHAVTHFSGPWPSTAGTDVDLELQNSLQAPVACIGTGGGMNPQPHPNQAEEEIVYAGYVEEGKWTVRVGAISTKCSNTAYYQNARSVPYTLTLALLFHHPHKLV